MKRIIRRKKSGYALGFTLCFIGLFILFTVLWEAWPHISNSPDAFSALESYLWTKQIDFVGVSLKLMHLTIISVTLLVLGIFLLALSRQVFSVSAEENILLKCPYCKNHWKASRASGYAECPHCRQFVQPTVKKIGK